MKTDLPILIETNQFIAINKPAGLSVHNEDLSQTSVLQLMGRGLHLAHRLDKETSGVLLLAKNGAIASILMAALSSDQSKKYYRAILRGDLTKAISDSHFVWNWPISDKAEGRQNPQGKASDRIKAETHIDVITANTYFSEVQAQILTGRQHQIRKHAAIARHAIVGDPRYNDKAYNAKIFSLYNFERMLLHAERLQLRFDEKHFEITAPIPEIYSSLMNKPN